MTSVPGPERKRAQEFTEKQAAAKSKDEEKTAAVAAGLGAGATETQAFNVMAQHWVGSDLRKQRERIPTLSFCQAVRELRGLQEEGEAASRVTAAAGQGRSSVREASALYLARIAKEYNRVAAVIGEESLPAGTAPTLKQAEMLAAELNRRDGNLLETPLAVAVRHGASTALGEYRIAELIAAGVDLNATNKHGQTPLMSAANQGDEAAVRLLLATAGIDVNAQDSDGRTALMWAAKWGEQPIVQLLLATAGTNINLRDHDELSALDLAEHNHQTATALLLRQAGAL